MLFEGLILNLFLKRLSDMQTLLLYLLCGGGIAYLTERFFAWIDIEETFRLKDRVLMILFWPLIALFFLYNFISGVLTELNK